MIGAAKDVAAGGVLLAAVGACVVGASVVAAHL
jgi:diacylglycerol kinase